MERKSAAVLVATIMLAGCGGGWRPWSSSSGSDAGPQTPPGATAYACEGNKRLLVRFESNGKSAWVIHRLGEYRLDRVATASGDRFTNGVTTLAVKDGEATLDEKGAVEFAKCKVEGR